MLELEYLASGLPTLIVWSQDDPVVPVAHAHQTHAHLPNSRLEIFEGSTHQPHHHSAERFVEVHDRFPEPCRHLLESLAVVYRNDAVARERRLSPEARLRLPPLFGRCMPTPQLANRFRIGWGRSVFWRARSWASSRARLRIPSA